MNWLSGWLDRFRPDSKPQLSDEQLERLRHWQAQRTTVRRVWHRD